MLTSPVDDEPSLTGKTQPTNVAVLGASGSIGAASLDVLSHLPVGRWQAWGVSAHRQLRELSQRLIATGLRPKFIVASDPDSASMAQGMPWPEGSELLFGGNALVDLATHPQCDTLIAAIVGRAGLESTLAAVQAGKRVGLANKEALVVGGCLVCEARDASGAELIPVDSEHSAIFQCIQTSPSPPRRLILTASGGPFRTSTGEQMRQASVADALAHPTWQMGRKISIDSATMMNKALEIIEARWLFDVPPSKIQVMIHPQSVIHSMVEFVDGSVLAQLSPPDMRLPIQYAITYPERLQCPVSRLDTLSRYDWEMSPADPERFPALTLGFEVAAAGGTAGAVLNAANEAAVQLFLDGEIRFTEIVPACRSALENHHFEQHPTLQRLLEVDRWARAEVQRWHSGTRA